MSGVNPLRVMLEPVLNFLIPWVQPASHVVTALAILYCLLLATRVCHYHKNDPDTAEARKKCLVSLRNGILSSVAAVAVVFALRWGIELLSRWILL